MKKKLRRSDSFLGIHFDFHATETDENIGANTTREMIQKVISKTGVDYIQTDCKGHPGFVSYKTKLSNQAPHIKFDALKLYREVTEENGVALYMHYSGVWDTNAIKNHPSWGRLDENGNTDPNNISFFEGYTDELLIPQLMELCDDYKVDGVWLDGECWAVCQDFSEKAQKEFTEKTGITEIPKNPEDKYFYEFTEFTRNNFINYLNHYTKTLHKHNPDFQLCSNWAFTSYMPQKVCADVDFLSGDYPLNNSVRVAQLEARCMQNQGMPWDLMAWGFGGQFGRGVFSTKTAVQLKQEAAIVLSLGGGFQIYYCQNRDGSIKDYILDIFAEVAEFCRERQSLCHKAKPIPEIALLYSTYNFYKKNKRVFSGWDNITQNISGVLNCLTSSQKAVEIIMEHNEIEKYPLIIIPELDYLEEEYIKKLKNYVNNGGRLIALGRSVEFFKDILGLSEMSETNFPQYLRHNNFICGIEAASYYVKTDSGTLGEFSKLDNFLEKGSPAASITNYGKGQISGIYFQLGEDYNIGNLSLIRDFLSDVIDTIYPLQLIKIEENHGISLTIAEKDDKIMLNLINMNGPHSNGSTYVFSEIPPTGKVRVKIRKKLSKITIYPENREIDFIYKDNESICELDNVEIHTILVLEE